MNSGSFHWCFNQSQLNCRNLCRSLVGDVKHAPVPPRQTAVEQLLPPTNAVHDDDDDHDAALINHECLILCKDRLHGELSLLNAANADVSVVSESLLPRINH